MLSAIFEQMFAMSISATIVILLVLFIRKLLGKSPKIFSYILWSVVLIRLLIPVNIESKLSIVPDTSKIEVNAFIGSKIETSKSNVNNTYINDEIITETTFDNNAQINNKNTNHKAENYWDSSVTEQTNEVSNSLTENENIWDRVTKVFSFIWGIGVVLLTSKSIIDLLKLKRTLGTAVLYKDNIYISEKIATAFVLGIIKPKIYIPEDLDKNAIEYIVKHEEIHIKRQDTLFRFLGFIAVIIHWFNPLVWLAYSKSCTDMEMSCDERVLKELGKDIKQDYSSSLLALATKGSKFKPIPLAFAENNTKSRIRNVLNYRKPKEWLVLISVLIVVMSFATLLTSAKGNDIIADLENVNSSNVSDITKIEIFINDENLSEFQLKQLNYESFVNLISNVEIDLSDNMYNIYSSDLDGLIRIDHIDGTYMIFKILNDYDGISIRDRQGTIRSYRVLYPKEFKTELNDYLTKYNSSYKATLFEYRTPYVGAPSAFGDLRQLLPLSKYVTDSTFEITNKGGLNGVVWNIETEEDYIDTPELYQSVRIAFALIGNLERLTIVSHNTVYDYTNSYTYSKDYFELMYNDSERANTEDFEVFKQLIDDILKQDYYIPMSTETVVIDGKETKLNKSYAHGALMSSNFSGITVYPKDLNLNVASTITQCVIIQNNGEVYNKEVWDRFLENVSSKKGAIIRIVQYNENNEATITSIMYNGSYFEVEKDSRRDSTGEQVLVKNTYDNLVSYMPRLTPTPNLMQTNYSNYYLTNQKEITTTDFENGVDGVLIYSNQKLKNK